MDEGTKRILLALCNKVDYTAPLNAISLKVNLPCVSASCIVADREPVCKTYPGTCR
jgi:hypothetical protein